MSPVKAVGLLSGGLDSILAARVVQAQGIEVRAITFISPFFGSSIKGREGDAVRRYKENFGIDAEIIDVSEEYLGVVGDPRYGYGKNFNPCIDCKIFLFKKALAIMEETGAKFLITGEVVGQRPMSQKRGTMDLIAMRMGASDILLRPLSAKIPPPTLPEREGWVDREKLLGFSGRSRKPQIALAKELGIGGYPTPGGGCSLTDPILAPRVQRYFRDYQPEARAAEDLRLILSGRPFRFPGGSLLATGRSEGENLSIQRLSLPGDEFCKVADLPGPLGLFRPGKGGIDERILAASVLLRYCPRAPEEYDVGFGPTPDAAGVAVRAKKATDAELEPWRP